MEYIAKRSVTDLEAEIAALEQNGEKPQEKQVEKPVVEEVLTKGEEK